MMDATKLAPIGREFLAVVQLRWPDFSKHAAVDGSGSLVIEYPSPTRPADALLWISADADFDEIIIGFGAGHSHGGPWTDPAAADFGFRSSVQSIDDILSETVVGYTVRSGQSGIGRLADIKSAPYWEDVQSIQSWQGTHDRTSSNPR